MQLWFSDDAFSAGSFAHGALKQEWKAFFCTSAPTASRPLSLIVGWESDLGKLGER